MRVRYSDPRSVPRRRDPFPGLIMLGLLAVVIALLAFASFDHPSSTSPATTGDTGEFVLQDTVTTGQTSPAEASTLLPVAVAETNIFATAKSALTGGMAISADLVGSAASSQFAALTESGQSLANVKNNVDSNAMTGASPDMISSIGSAAVFNGTYVATIDTGQGSSSSTAIDSGAATCAALPAGACMMTNNIYDLTTTTLSAAYLAPAGDIDLSATSGFTDEYVRQTQRFGGETVQIDLGDTGTTARPVLDSAYFSNDSAGSAVLTSSHWNVSGADPLMVAIASLALIGAAAMALGPIGLRRMDAVLALTRHDYGDKRWFRRFAHDRGIRLLA